MIDKNDDLNKRLSNLLRQADGQIDSDFIPSEKILSFISATCLIEILKRQDKIIDLLRSINGNTNQSAWGTRR